MNLIMMKTDRLILLSTFITILLSSCTAMAQPQKQLVRLAIIEVDSTQLDRYNDFLREEIEASIQKEPGVITLYGVAEKENPERVTLFETYADSAQYKAHLTTPHFQKYKQGTLQMVKHLELIETQPILYTRKPELAKARSGDLFIRLIKMEIATNSIDSFHKLANNVMLPGLKKEPGVLVMYAVAEKNKPAHISILEVYANAAAYENHVKTSHFIKYKTESKNMIKTLTLVDVNPILLGSKPQ
ncbi:putative quinol monooxygenase [Ohtaekwangia kribbensis]|uniref:Quinol monooxygenase n=1 Tax=Ohtaekwangia kribbensis TaxID=688913 RepID=A0ABW3K7X2_9BACT